MTAETVENQLVVAPTFEWRCGAPRCFYKPLLALFGPNGGVHIHVSGRRSYALNIIADTRGGPVKQHCPSCHAWRELAWDDDQQRVVEREATGFIPLIGCKCEFERYAEQLAQRRKEDRDGTTEGS